MRRLLARALLAVGLALAAPPLWAAIHAPSTAASAVRNTAVGANTAVATLTTVISAAADTLPSATGGTQITSASLTLRNSSCSIRYEAEASFGASATMGGVMLLGKDSDTNALEAKVFTFSAVGQGHVVVLTGEWAPGDTATHTFSLRAGPSSANNMYLNGLSASRVLGGAVVSKLRLTEVC